MEKCKVGVVGVGVMASGTAALFISNGYPTVVYARTAESCEKGIRNVTENLDDLIAHGLMTEGQKNRALTLYSVTTDYADFAVSCNLTVGNIAACNFADRRNCDNVTNFDSALLNFTVFGSEHTLDSCLNIFKAVVNYAVHTHFNAVTLCKRFCNCIGADVEAYDDSV